MDFALWKAAKPGEPYWESPWGKGRPGWHIECSVMSLKYLGETFDFHGGGSDLIFPHHENEIAQSQGAIGSDTSFARYWLHNGFITVRNEKMSKSADNFFLVKDILAKYSGETVRFFILQTHYRSPLDFADERLAEAQTSLARLRHTMECVRELKKLNGASDTAANLAERSKELMHEFEAAMNDDFNTALAIGYMFSLSKEINIYYHSVTAEGLSFDGKNFATAAENYRLMAALLGIFEQREAVEQKGDDLTDKLMGIIIDLRQSARAAKDFATADKIRDALKEIGIVIEDGKSGARWKRA